MGLLTAWLLYLRSAGSVELMSFTYLDSSVLLRWILSEPKQLDIGPSSGPLVSLELIEVECMRTLDRLRLYGQLSDDKIAMAARKIRASLSALRLVSVDRGVLDRAKEPFATLLGTLDAMHLSTALLIRASLSGETSEPVFLTHDQQLGRAAMAHGFSVKGI